MVLPCFTVLCRAHTNDLGGKHCLCITAAKKNKSHMEDDIITLLKSLSAISLLAGKENALQLS